MLVVLISSGGDSGGVLGIVVVVIGCVGGSEIRENAAWRVRDPRLCADPWRSLSLAACCVSGRCCPRLLFLGKIAVTGVDLRIVVWVKEFLLGRSQRFRVEGQPSDEIRVTSGLPQGAY